MAQQTINVGAAPNDGTGTPLRTAFQYTNSNFSELYTAVGPSGNNIVVPGSATITGDLTVRTTGLTVNSSGVGVGTSSQSSFLGNSPKKLVIGDGTQTPALTLYGGTANVSGIYYAKGTVGNEAYRGFIEYNHAVDALTVGISGSTAMTLNSTGLGVGTTTIPFKFTVANAASVNTMCLVNTASNASRLVFGTNAVPGDSWTQIEGDARATGYFAIRTNDTERLKVDSTGNINVTSGNLVMATSGKGIDFSATASGSGTMTSELLNDYEEGTWTGTLTGGTTNPTTPVTATGRYTKVGRSVTVQITFSAVNTTGASGLIGITGLPFANNSVSNSVGSASLYLIANFTGSPFASLGLNESFINFYANNSGGAFSDVTHNAGTPRFLSVSITYTV